MTIFIDNKSGAPIYDQIYSQIKSQIISGELSFVTTKRAYDELEKDGFIYTIQAKGCYVAPKNVELLREENLRRIEDYIDEIVKLAATCNLTNDEIIEMLRFALKEEE